MTSNVPVSGSTTPAIKASDGDEHQFSMNRLGSDPAALLDNTI
jgi:hypothetical protein